MQLPSSSCSNTNPEFLSKFPQFLSRKKLAFVLPPYRLPCHCLPTTSILYRFEVLGRNHFVQRSGGVPTWELQEHIPTKAEGRKLIQLKNASWFIPRLVTIPLRKNLRGPLLL